MALKDYSDNEAARPLGNKTSYPRAEGIQPKTKNNSLKLVAVGRGLSWGIHTALTTTSPASRMRATRWDGAADVALFQFGVVGAISDAVHCLPSGCTNRNAVAALGVILIWGFA